MSEQGGELLCIMQDYFLIKTSLFCVCFSKVILSENQMEPVWLDLYWQEINTVDEKHVCLGQKPGVAEKSNNIH